MDYLPNYKNPCWYAKVTNGSDNPYALNPYNRDREANLVDPWRALAKKRDRGETTRTRCLPLVYLIGVTKSGTTDLYDSIVKHTEIAEPSMKEPMWWNRFTIGEWNSPTGATFTHYVDLFDRASERIELLTDAKSLNHNVLTIDGCPAYLWDYDGWQKIPGNKGLDEPRFILAHSIKELVPEAKIIAILRHPTERLFSQFRMKRPTASVQNFHERVVQALDAFRDCLLNHTLRHCTYKDDYQYERQLYFRASLYSVYLEDWLKVFPKEQVLVLKAEDYYFDRRSSLEQVFKFLELGPLKAKTWNIILAAKVKNSKQSYALRLKDDMLNSTREMLNTFFQPYNERLAEILKDKRFLW
ncbi:hypothetical protein CAPTEDRAFT_107906 [Capitella teleta]|uniref:Sulfotransferase domain-containing protein n=1 Tax=Capitella teleta TaxID=283909 RepID=R7VL97_CAPTE|nr:hypothetical protein CAPTEDRAFT_107906 [Capitella teleta]|eukprot:ELU18071.1 hypothetical protein CAPTEDRAFT_107906 [Capitella teleta]